MQKSKRLVKKAEHHLRHARRNVGQAWKEVQEMKLLLVRVQRLHPLKPQS